MAKTQNPPATVPPDSVTVVDGPVEGAPSPPAARADDRSIGDLFSELTTETTTLIKQEIRLVKAEATQEAKEAGAAIGAAVAGGALAYTGLIALVIGLGWGLGKLLDEDLDMIWLGLLIVGAVVALIGYVMLNKGLDKIKALSSHPLDTTTQSLKEDKQWIKQQTP